MAGRAFTGLLEASAGRGRRLQWGAVTPSSSTAPLPGYSVRAPRLDDAEAVAALRRAAYAGRQDGDVTAASILQEWALPRMDLEHDAWLVLAHDGTPAASALVFEDLPAAYVRIGCVHPDHDGVAVQGYLLDLAEGRTRARLAAAGRDGGNLTVVAFESERATLDLYAGRGYEHVRTFLRLAAALEPATPQATVPPGIAVRPFRRGVDEHAVYEAVQEAFLDHWEPTELSFEEWLAVDCEAPAVDHSLWRVAWDGDAVAGVATASAGGRDGWVDELAVRRPWRGRGLGRALLLTAFAVLRARGLARALLSVDTDNPTGAMGLYGSAGMTQSGEAHLVLRRPLAPS